MRRSPSPSTLPQLKSALTTLAAEFTVAAPPEVYRSFPDFKHELTEMLMTASADQLKNAMVDLYCTYGFCTQI